MDLDSLFHCSYFRGLQGTETSRPIFVKYEDGVLRFYILGPDNSQARRRSLDINYTLGTWTAERSANTESGSYRETLTDGVDPIPGRWSSTETLMLALSPWLEEEWSSVLEATLAATVLKPLLDAGLSRVGTLATGRYLLCEEFGLDIFHEQGLIKP